MSISRDQAKAARLLVGWSQSVLAGRAGLGASTIEHFETGRRRPSLESVIRIRQTLEAAGVEFIPGQPGVRRKPAEAPRQANDDQNWMDSRLRSGISLAGSSRVWT